MKEDESWEDAKEVYDDDPARSNHTDGAKDNITSNLVQFQPTQLLQQQENAIKLQQVMETLGLTEYYPNKLELNHARLRWVREVVNMTDVPWFLLHKILSLDTMTVTSGDFFPKKEETNKKPAKSKLKNFYSSQARDQSNVLHPMDAISALFLCASPAVKAVLAHKLFVCQISIPLLLPDTNLRSLNMMMGALANITCLDKERKEVSLANHNCYIVSIVCLGTDLLDKVGDMVNGTIQKAARLQNQKVFHHGTAAPSSYFWGGMVDMGWYLPSSKQQDISQLPETTLFLNLRGDLRKFSFQHDMLKKLSSLVVVICSGDSLAKMLKEHPDMSFLEDLTGSESDTALLLCDGSKSLQHHQERLEKFVEAWEHRGKRYEIVEGESEASAEILGFIADEDRKLKLKSLSDFAKQSGTTAMHSEFALEIDDNSAECLKGKKSAEMLIKNLRGKKTSSNLKVMKAESVPLQFLWRDWVTKNKELERDIRKVKDGDQQKKKLEDDMSDIKKKQRERCVKLSPLMKAFLGELSSARPTVVQQHMLRIFGQCLDDISRKHLPDLYKSYKESWFILEALKSEEMKPHEQKKREEDIRALEKICREKEKEISDASLGLEHILREVGQIYEVANASDVRLNLDKRMLPSKMAELLLSGQSIELLDGDASYVPVTWVTAVLKKVEEQIGGQSKKVFVLSILGLQSSGKSTLLNTLFGLQFSVSAGRCTRGVYAQLIPACQRFTPGIDYILVVDTEGLRAPELGCDTYLHDHEIATFVVGLGDLTIINLKGELASEMREVLEIVIHAFLRISQAIQRFKLQGSCMFVHQNVSADDAGEKNFFSRQSLLKKLDEMTEAAAQQESVIEYKKFGDVIKFDLKRDVLYFADLWQGNPPMASVNPGYSRDAQDLKKLVEANMVENIHLAQSLTGIAFKLGNLWNSILKENFIFSFKNSVEIRAYTSLETIQSNMKWDFQDKALELTNKAKNDVTSSRKNDLDKLLYSLKTLVETEMNNLCKKKMEELEMFFNDSSDKVVLEQWKHRSILTCGNEAKITRRKLQEDLEGIVTKQRRIITQEDALKDYKEEILRNAKELATELQKQKLDKKLDEKQLGLMFDDMWNKCIARIVTEQETVDWTTFIKSEIKELLHQLLFADHFQLNLAMMDYPLSPLHFDILYVHHNVITIEKWMTIKEEEKKRRETRAKRETRNPLFSKVKDAANAAWTYAFGSNKYEDADACENVVANDMNRIFRDVQTLVKEKYADLPFESKYAREILTKFQNWLGEMNMMNSARFQLQKPFAMQMTVCVASYLAEQFGKYQEAYIKRTNPRYRLRVTYYDQFLGLFRNIYYQSINDLTIAEAVCQCLAPKIREAVTREMPRLMTDHMIYSSNSTFFHTKKDLEKQVLSELLTENKYDQFHSYIKDTSECFNIYIVKIVEKELFSGQETKFGEIEMDHLKVITRHVSNSIAEVMGTEPDCINSFVDQLVEKIKGVLPVPPSTFEAALHMEVQDFVLFASSLEKNMTRLEEELIKEAMEKKLSHAKEEIKSCCQLLFNKCIGCCEQCPFCKTSCSLTNADHEGVKHSAAQHMCQGLGSYRYEKSQKLVVNNCSTDVASNATFRNDKTEWIYQPYKDYAKWYPDWNIVPDASVETSLYWKRVFAKFSKEFAETYGAEEPDIPSHWHEITDAEALQSLDNI